MSQEQVQQAQDSKKGKEYTKARNQIAIVWYIGSLILLIVLIFQVLNGRYGSEYQIPFQWMTPHVLPTIGLITGVIIVENTRVIRSNAAKKIANLFLYRLCLWTSVLHVSLLNISIFIQPFTPLEPLELMEFVNYILWFIQGTVSAFLGVFFVRSK